MRLAIDRVSVAYDGTRVVHDVSLTLPPGTWIALIGPNGAGKSTLLKAVASLLPFEGRIGFDDDSVGSLNRRRVSQLVAYVPQRPVLLLDEPTVALDVGHQQQVLELIDELRTEHDLTVVTALHDLTLAGQFADRLVMLAGGVVVAEGTAGEVLTASTIHDHYGASVRVEGQTDGSVLVIPIRRRVVAAP